jgi:hypothetical protein
MVAVISGRLWLALEGKPGHSEHALFNRTREPRAVVGAARRTLLRQPVTYLGAVGCASSRAVFESRGVETDF